MCTNYYANLILTLTLKWLISFYLFSSFNILLFVCLSPRLVSIFFTFSLFLKLKREKKEDVHTVRCFKLVQEFLLLLLLFTSQLEVLSLTIRSCGITMLWLQQSTNNNMYTLNRHRYTSICTWYSIIY